jgi:DNA-binding NarL/FixJ family response regulator
MTPLSILIVDQHPIFRLGVHTVLGATADFAIVGEASTGAEGVRLATMLQPDLVLMSLHLADIDGIEATRRVLAACERTRVLVVTEAEHAAVISALLHAGAHGHLPRDSQPVDVVRAVRAVGRRRLQ